MDGLAGGGDTIPDCDRSIYFFPAGPSLSVRSNSAASTSSQVDRTCLYHLGQACIRMALLDVSEIFRDRTT